MVPVPQGPRRRHHHAQPDPIAKDGSDWVIDVLDEYFLQPYDYQGLLERNPDNGYARAVADECERQYRLLTEAGILTGWHEGMYV